MPLRKALTGNGAMAQAMRQINPEVVAAFPITPSTQVIEDFAEFVADGAVGTELVTVESEHSAMSACIGASLAGARAMTATASQGLALMWEMLYVAASMRRPILMTIVNRALAGAISIHCDHADSMGARDAGWIQVYSENNQEAYDNMIMAPAIAEHPDVRLPLMVCLDGFIISHAIETMQIEDDETVREFIGEYETEHSILDTANPSSWGALDLQDYYIEHKRGQMEGMFRAESAIMEVLERFEDKFGRSYDIFESYCLEDAERVIVAAGSSAGEIKQAVDALRQKGEKVGLLKIRVFRPFPYGRIREALSGAGIVTVLDRSASFGAYGPLFVEIRAALADLDAPPLTYSRTYGLGGRETFPSDIADIFAESGRYLQAGKVDRVSGILNVRGDR